MAKFTPSVLTTTYGAVAALNANFDDIADLLEQCLFRDGTAPNAMNVDIDMNNFKVQNLGEPTDASDAVRLSDLVTYVEAADGLGALLSATSGAALIGTAQNRTVAEFIGSRMVDAGKYGFDTSNTAAENVTAFAALLAGEGGGDYPTYVVFKPGTYQLGATPVSTGNLHLWAYGATFVGPTVQFSCDADNFKIFGAQIVDTDSTGANFGFNFVGDRNGLIDCTLVKTPEAGGYHGYIQLTATNCVIENLALRGSNGIFLEGTGHRINGVDAIARTAGGDDLFAIKARNQTTGDIIISGVKAEGYSNVAAFGSEIGTLGAASASRTGRVQNVTISGIAKNCTYFAFIKPGAIDNGSAYDWRDGLVDNITIKGTITDTAGTKMVRPVVISASRGALVNNIDVDVQVSGRTYNSGSGEQRTGIDIYIPDYSAATPPAAAPTIQNVAARMRVFDRHDGVAAGGSVAGAPFQHFARVAKETSSHGTMSGIRLNVEGNGCAEAGIITSTGLGGAVEIERARLDNCDTSVSGQGAIHPQSHIKLNNVEIGTTAAFPIGSTAINGVVYSSKEEIAYIGTHAAGAAANIPLWVAPKDCYVHSVLFVDGAGIPVDATNYTTLSVINNGTGGAFVAAGTNVFTFSANTAVAAYFNDAIASADALNIPKGTVIRFTKTDSGTGQAVTNMRAIIRYVEHGV